MWSARCRNVLQGFRAKPSTGRRKAKSTPSVDARVSSNDAVDAVRCCCMSGLSLRHVARRGPAWRCTTGSISITGARKLCNWKLDFPIPSRLTVCPCFSSDLPTSPTATRFTASQAAAGARQLSFFVISARTMRAIRLASATACMSGRWPATRVLYSRCLQAG